jgi:hypothetical protein
MGSITLSPLLHDALAFIGKHAIKVNVSETLLSHPSMQIQLPRFCDSSFTVKAADLLTMLRHTQHFDLKEGGIEYEYKKTVAGSIMRIRKSIKTYDESYEIRGGDPLLSVRVGRIRLLSPDDCEIVADSTGCLSITTRGIVETSTEYSHLRVLESSVGSVRATARARDLAILEDMEDGLVISFLETHILAYSLLSSTTKIVQVKVLSMAY